VKYFDKIIGLEIKQNLLDRWAQREKRALDLIGSLLGLILLLPFLVLIGLMVFIDSPGRIFYRQERIGKGGKVFKLLKYRTMQLNADQVLQSQLERDPRLKREWDQYQKLKNDPRITRVGRLLRRFSLDELPQLWNVFLGDMSLVGPRPMMVKQQEVYGEPFRHYVRVTPGITGMWQINGRNHTTFARRAELDVQYVANWSIWLDIYILARTIWVVVKRDGAC
jgi:Undecaprenyl-phosphate galactose phosphotransferase WbaP